MSVTTEGPCYIDCHVPTQCLARFCLLHSQRPQQIDPSTSGAVEKPKVFSNFCPTFNKLGIRLTGSKLLYKLNTEPDSSVLTQSLTPPDLLELFYGIYGTVGTGWALRFLPPSVLVFVKRNIL